MPPRKRQKREAVEEQEEQEEPELPELQELEEGPIPAHAAAGPPRKVKRVDNGVERKFRFLTSVNGNQELDPLRLQHHCSSTVKKRPNFKAVTMACKNQARKGCPYRLWAQREQQQEEQGQDRDTIHVYAHSKHNHPISSEAEYIKPGPAVLVVDDEEHPPAQFCTANGLEWHFLTRVDNYEECTECRRTMHCTKIGGYVNSNSRQFRAYCYERWGKKCQFAMLARKTASSGYLLYTHGAHTCQWGTSESSKKPCRTSEGQKRGQQQLEEFEPEAMTSKAVPKQKKPKMRTKEEESGREEQAGPGVEAGDGQMDENNDEEEAQQQPEEADRLTKIHRRLGKALRKGKVDRAKRWMAGTEQEEEMGRVLDGICLENVLVLLDMADREMVEDRASRHFWIPWLKAAFSTRGTSLAKVKGIRTRFESSRIQRLIERLFDGIGIEEGEGQQNEEKPRKKKRQKEDEVEEKPKRMRKNGNGTDVDEEEVEEKQRKEKKRKRRQKEDEAEEKQREDGTGTDVEKEEEEEEIDERPPKLIRKNAGIKLRVSILKPDNYHID